MQLLKLVKLKKGKANKDYLFGFHVRTANMKTIYISMEFFFFLLITIGSNLAFGQRAESSFLRFDGFYETTCYLEEGDDEGSQDYLRFYASGKVISVSTDCEGTADELKSWFKLDAEQVSTADYKIIGRRLFFSTKSKSGVVKYEGRLGKKGLLKLKWKSLINGKRGHEQYKFIQIADLT